MVIFHCYVSSPEGRCLHSFLYGSCCFLRILYFDLRCENLLVCHPHSSQNEPCGWLLVRDSIQFAQNFDNWISIRNSWFVTILNLISEFFSLISLNYESLQINKSWELDILPIHMGFATPLDRTQPSQKIRCLKKSTG